MNDEGVTRFGSQFKSRDIAFKSLKMLKINIENVTLNMSLICVPFFQKIDKKLLSNNFPKFYIWKRVNTTKYSHPKMYARDIDMFGQLCTKSWFEVLERRRKLYFTVWKLLRVFKNSRIDYVFLNTLQSQIYVKKYYNFNSDCILWDSSYYKNWHQLFSNVDNY